MKTIEWILFKISYLGHTILFIYMYIVNSFYFTKDFINNFQWNSKIYKIYSKNLLHVSLWVISWRRDYRIFRKKKFLVKPCIFYHSCNLLKIKTKQSYLNNKWSGKLHVSLIRCEDTERGLPAFHYCFLRCLFGTTIPTPYSFNSLYTLNQAYSKFFKTQI